MTTTDSEPRYRNRSVDRAIAQAIDWWTSLSPLGRITALQRVEERGDPAETISDAFKKAEYDALAWGPAAVGAALPPLP